MMFLLPWGDRFEAGVTDGAKFVFDTRVAHLSIRMVSGSKRLKIKLWTKRISIFWQPWNLIREEKNNNARFISDLFQRCRRLCTDAEKLCSLKIQFCCYYR
jgi:hypothetical protein